ncbi:hypothetical protein MOV08_24690 [Streptomyces yunnanensis]|uniref:N-acetyltransferase domain-containing protein n=1 Tax=Streptomyces yunnanensis TaxID=156453 RepID=A0ABY8ABQ0_9ACTN|nr:hypothetical protein [Streptomyces yunnanensis]WEB42136.1 hypothetical protein MOV08_24690 [Streptomyces yunnanensis]
MTTDRVRRLTPADTDEILRIIDLEELDAKTLARELAAGDDYLWLGLDTAEGRLGAVHRSMKWGELLLLKGVFVAESARGSGAALELAFALRDAARRGGYAGLAVWVEPHKPEAGLARMLRLRETGPLIHRFEVSVPADGPPISGPVPDAASGTLLPGSPEHGAYALAPLVVDLLSGGAPATVHWVLDRHRLVLSGFPLPSVVDLHRLITDVGPLAKAKGAAFIEFPVPAADIPSALSLAAIKARRLSRTPVRLGRLDFGTDRDAGRRDTDEAA